MKLKLWWWHFIGVKLKRFLYKLDEQRVKVLCEIKRKIENIKFDRNEKTL